MRSTIWIVITSLAVLAGAVAQPSGDAWARRSRRRAFGSLELICKTKGAEVIVDGKVVGKIPLAPIRLKKGKHTLKLSLKGYTQFLDVVRIRPGDVTKLEIDLIPIGGVVEVTARQSGARVFVDGTFVGVAPVEAEALVGDRTVRVSKAGYHDFIKRIKVVGGRRYAVSAALKQLPQGSTPYRPAPPAPPEWYERWYVWVGAAAGVTAVAAAIIVPVLMTQGDPIEDFGGLRFTASSTTPAE